jgi:hypothetical protein
MNDEATTTLSATLDQQTMGRKWLIETFATLNKPMVGWQIDPFGHSTMTPRVMRKLGVRYLVLNRIDDLEKDRRKANQSLQFYWNITEGNDPLRTMSVLTHVLDSHYSTPFCMNMKACDGPADIESNAACLIEAAQQRSLWYRSSHILIPFGGDFAFTSAETDFACMDSVIHAIRNMSNSGLQIRYSTLIEYFNAVENELTAAKLATEFSSHSATAVVDAADFTYASVPAFPTTTNLDFFPYTACSPCDAPHCKGVPCGTPDATWSGYYFGHPEQVLIIVRFVTNTIAKIRCRIQQVSPCTPLLSFLLWCELETPESNYGVLLAVG